jgi:hypothetical protein
MSTDNTLSGLENQAFALMSRLHVIVRRQIGRVTDIEYMRIDPVYCRYVMNMARDMKNDDLNQICEKLEEVFFGPEGLFIRTPPKQPLLTRLAGNARQPATAAPPMASDPAMTAPVELSEQEKEKQAEQHHIELNEAVEKGYIGRLR